MTTTSTTYASAPRPKLSQGRLWFGFTAAAAAWVVHGISGFFITWQACQDGDGDWTFLSELEVRWLLGVITITLMALAAAAGLVSFSSWRRLRERRRFIEAEAPDREEFMALGGVLVSTVFFLGILWAGLGPVLLDVCVTAK